MMTVVASALWIVSLAISGPGAFAADKVRIGFTPNFSPSANIAIVMERTNVCQKNGLECEMLPFVAGGPQMEALLADKLDFAFVGDAPAVIFAARGGKGKFVARLQDYRGALVVRRDGSFKTLADLRNKKVAGFISSGVYAAQLYDWLLDAGLNPVKDIELINLKPADWITALRRKEIDAFMAWDPLAAIASYESDLVILKEERSVSPCVAVLGDKFLMNRDATVRLIMAYKEAMLYMALNKTVVNDWLAEYARIPAKAIAHASEFDRNYANARRMADLRTAISAEDVDRLQAIGNLLAKLKQTAVAPKIQSYVAMEYVQDADKRLAGYDPATVRAK
jgi:ABC-type nitrate/sulfonate/bicarbonate transport system substrate-binding protein